MIEKGRRRPWSRRLKRAVEELVLPSPEPSADEPPPPSLDPDLVPLLTELGGHLLESGQATNEVEVTLRNVARSLGATTVRAFVLPTGIIVQVDSQDGVATHFSTAGSRAFRLDQVAALDELVQSVESGITSMAHARLELAKIATSPPRFGPVLAILGHTILTVGFGLCLNPTSSAMWAYVVLGAVVGLLRVVVAGYPTLATALPVLAAFLVTVLAIEVLAPHLGTNPLGIVAPPLVSFLPGAALTTATIELTHNQVVSGASRLVFGMAQLLLLSFGVVAGIVVVGQPESAPSSPLGTWAPWLGVALVAVGDLLFSSAPKRSLPWIALALYVAFAAQALGSVVLSPQLSGFLGGLVIVPMSRLIARAPSGPPAMVTTLPAFWLLVPGALGFIGVSEVATSQAVGADDLVNLALALFSIALGVLTGTGLTREASSIEKAINRLR